MIKVSVHNNKDNRDFGAKFETQELADKWIAEQIASNSWGKAERIYILKPDQPIPSDAIGIMPEPIKVDPENDLDSGDRLKYVVPVEYVITQTDITVEHNLELAKKAVREQAAIDLAALPKIIPANQVSDVLNKILEVMGIK